MAKYMSVDDAYNLLKENGAYRELGGYVIKAGDTKVITTYDDLMNTLRLDYLDNNFMKTPSKNFVEIFYRTPKASEMSVPIGITDPWPCTSKGFLANTNGAVAPEYLSGYFTPSEAELYLVDGFTGTRKLIGIYDADAKRFVTIEGKYWTQSVVKLLKGE